MLSVVPRLKSALPDRVRDPKFTFLLLEKVSVAPAVELPTDNATSELT